MNKWWTSNASVAELRECVLPLLKGIPGPGIATTDLMRRMGSTKAHMRSLAIALRDVRIADPMLTEEEQGAGVFGNPLILWHDPEL